MRRNKGFSLMELVVVLMISTVLSGALFTVFVGTFSNNRIVHGMNDAEKGAREQLDGLVDHIRNAQQYQPSVADPHRVVSAATATSVTYYVNAAGQTVRYYLSGNDLRRDATGAGGTDDVVFSGVSSLDLRYFKATGTAYYTGVAATTDPVAPSAAELPLLTQIDIRVTVQFDGQEREIYSQVRLRNSPRKQRL